VNWTLQLVHLQDNKTALYLQHGLYFSAGEEKAHFYKVASERLFNGFIIQGIYRIIDKSAGDYTIFFVSLS